MPKLSSKLKPIKIEKLNLDEKPKRVSFSLSKLTKTNVKASLTSSVGEEAGLSSARTQLGTNANLEATSTPTWTNDNDYNYNSDKSVANSYVDQTSVQSELSQKKEIVSEGVKKSTFIAHLNQSPELTSSASLTPTSTPTPTDLENVVDSVSANVNTSDSIGFDVSANTSSNTSTHTSVTAHKPANMENDHNLHNTGNSDVVHTNGNSQNHNQRFRNRYKPDREVELLSVRGILDDFREGHGIVRMSFGEDDKDAYISTTQLKKFKLRSGDVLEGLARAPKEGERYWGLIKLIKINGLDAEQFANQERPKFKSFTPVFPNEQLKLETGKEPISLRIIDMIAPIGKGQRSLIVSPPKAGKTSLLKDIASGVANNNPEVHLMAVLVGERPEEVTDIKRHIERITHGKGEVAASNFDESAQDQVRVAELALERAKRLVEVGADVVILLDSITRLARAYNLAMPTSGRTLSGGFDPAALHPPKRFFGAARNFEVQGSLTIVGTALVDTGSRMDDLVYEEFKGTGNQEIHLSRHLAERRVFPAIDVQKSGTRRDDLLVDPMIYQAIATLHRMLDTIDDRDERTMTLIEQLKRSNSNKEFLATLKG